MSEEPIENPPERQSPPSHAAKPNAHSWRGWPWPFLKGFSLTMIWGISFGVNFLNLRKIDAYYTLLLLSALCGCVYCTRYRRAVWVGPVTLCLMILTVIYTPLVPRMVEGLQRCDTPEKCDAVLVLGTYVSDSGKLSYEGVNRLLKGLSLIHENYAPVLILTQLPPIFPSGDEDLGMLMSLMSAPAEILRTEEAKNTYEEALAVKKLIQEKGFKKILLVTSPLHTYRAGKVFESQGIQVLVVPSDQRDNRLTRLYSLGQRWGAFWECFYESLGILKYRMSGWIH